MEGASRASLAAARSALDERAPASGAGELRGLAEQLFAVADLLHRELTVRRALADPSADPGARARLLDRLFGARLPEPALQLLRRVVRSRWNSPLDLEAAVEELGQEALLAAAEVDGSLDNVEDELFRFGRIIDREPELSLALSDVGLPADRKRSLLDRLLLERAHWATLRLVERSVVGPSRRSLDRTLEHLGERAADRRRRLVAVVRTARPLDAEQTARLQAAVSRLYGRQVQLQVDLDPTVLGGVVVRVGDEVIDGSVARRLAEARRRFGR
jgi:F-type H+-transporting ATPase subunit delta